MGTKPIFPNLLIQLNCVSILDDQNWDTVTPSLISISSVHILLQSADFPSAKQRYNTVSVFIARCFSVKVCDSFFGGISTPKEDEIAGLDMAEMGVIDYDNPGDHIR